MVLPQCCWCSFMNLFTDQECEKYINKNGLTEKVEKKILKIYESKGVKKLTYQGDLPEK